MTPEEFIQIIKNLNTSKSPFKPATIDTNYSSGRPKLLFDGETVASGKQYPYLSSYTPVAGDRVLLARVSSSYVILGKVV